MSASANDFRPVSEWIDLVKDPNSAFHSRMSEIYDGADRLQAVGVKMCLATLEAFADAYGADGKAILVRATGRVNLVGMHVV